MGLAENVVPFPAKPAFNKVRCPKCNTEIDAGCDCGVDYVQAKELAAQAIALNPELSTREIAKEIGVSHTTVVRAGLEHNVPNRHPREIAADAIQANPDMTNKDIAEKFGVGRGTVGTVRKLIESGEPLFPPKEDKPTNDRKRGESEEAAYGHRLEEFRRRIGVLASTCTSSQGIEIPYLSLEDAQDAVEEVKAAAAILRKLLNNLNEVIKSHKEETQS